MNIATIEELAYLLKQAKESNAPKPIVFLGAGASKTGGVPLAGEIIKDILEKYSDNPRIKKIKEEEKVYAELMARLSPADRNELLKGYIDKAKINVCHIYLAQLMVKGYIDYVLTVNFDNLMLRALALYNEFPPTYDMAILKDLTTTSFKEKSVVYLHGQHHGLWLLNTKEEMAKVNELIPQILHSIMNKRLWIFIGYSGTDPIFGHIKKLATRFDNGLYWVTYNENDPSEDVCVNLLNRDNANTYVIKGYDADSFMVSLNAELQLPQPQIVDKPFTSLNDTLENIVDIDDKEHFKGVKERLEIAKRNVATAIQQFEEGKVESNQKLKEEIDINLLKKQIIDRILTKKFDADEIADLDSKAKKLGNKQINELMASLYNGEATEIGERANLSNDEGLSIQGIAACVKAVGFNPYDSSVYNNWGNFLLGRARILKEESLYMESISKYVIASELDPMDDIIYFNWGNAIAALAQLNDDMKLYQDSIVKYQKATRLNPKNDFAYSSWGIALTSLAQLVNDEKLYADGIEMFQKAMELNPNNEVTYCSWGDALYNLGRLKKQDSFFFESIEKYKKTIELNPRNSVPFYSWGASLLELYKLKNDESLYYECIEKIKKSKELGGKDVYNLGCLYALRNHKTEAIQILEQSLDSREITLTHVESDDDWKLLKEDSDFIALLKKYK